MILELKNKTKTQVSLKFFAKVFFFTYASFCAKNMQKSTLLPIIKLFMHIRTQIGYSFCNFAVWMSVFCKQLSLPEAESLPVHLARNLQHVAFYRSAPIAHGRVRADIHEGRVVLLCYAAPVGIHACRR